MRYIYKAYTHKTYTHETYTLQNVYSRNVYFTKRILTQRILSLNVYSTERILNILYTPGFSLSGVPYTVALKRVIIEKNFL
jgi:hypothetical protein